MYSRQNFYCTFNISYRSGVTLFSCIPVPDHISIFFSVTGQQFPFQISPQTVQIGKTRKFIQKRQKKNAFEMKLLASMELFLRCGEEMVEELKNSDYEQLRADNLAAGSICHGDLISIICCLRETER